MRPVRLLLTLLGGVAALAVLSSVSRGSVLSSSGAVRRSTLRRARLPLHYNRLAAYYRACEN
jgi:hypothetical protein